MTSHALNLRPFTLATLRAALAAGWQLANRTRMVSFLYALPFTLLGLLIFVLLHDRGLLPFALAAAGGFMLFGPVLLAGFFGIARAAERGEPPGMGAITAGFRQAAPALWVLALVCLLLFLIFATDAAILYSYMVGGTPFTFASIPGRAAEASRFAFWAGVSGCFIAGLVYVVTAFSVPLLAERRAELVPAVVASVRLVFGNLGPALVWAGILGVLGVGSALLLPAFPVVLPWLAYAGRELARQVVVAADAEID